MSIEKEIEKAKRLIGRQIDLLMTEGLFKKHASYSEEGKEIKKNAQLTYHKNKVAELEEELSKAEQLVNGLRKEGLKLLKDHEKRTVLNKKIVGTEGFFGIGSHRDDYLTGKKGLACISIANHLDEFLKDYPTNKTSEEFQQDLHNFLEEEVTKNPAVSRQRGVFDFVCRFLNQFFKEAYAYMGLDKEDAPQIHRDKSGTLKKIEELEEALVEDRENNFGM